MLKMLTAVMIPPTVFSNESSLSAEAAKEIYKDDHISDRVTRILETYTYDMRTLDRLRLARPIAAIVRMRPFGSIPAAALARRAGDGVYGLDVQTAAGDEG
jgi:hypothetical protein